MGPISRSSFFGLVAVAVGGGFGLSPVTGSAAGDDPGIRVERGIEFARVGGSVLKLDLYRPIVAEGVHSPLLVWVHGGAWRRGSRDSMPLGAVVRSGWAIASVDYRLTPVARFPAQVHDINGAIRFLRAKAAAFGLDANRVAIAGASAGGHLAALVGVTNGHPDLEGDVGEFAGESSDVQAIVSFYGASNLRTILSQSTPHGLGVRIPALQLLLGGQPEDRDSLATLASPVAHVDRSDPPLYLLHGDQDPQMPINQSHELHGRYQRLQLPVVFEVVHGGAHGGKPFYEEERLHRVLGFLNRSVSGK